jgi:integrase
VVSARLGHAGYSITADLYQHVQPHVDQAAADRVADHILGSR